MKIFIIVILVLTAFLLAYLAFSNPPECKKSGETYFIGKEKCCQGLDFAPTADPLRNICLPKLPAGQVY